MKREYYVVDEYDLTIKKALLDLDSEEFFFTFADESYVFKDHYARAEAERIKWYNELTEDRLIRTGKAYKHKNIFASEKSAKERLKEVIIEKANGIQHKIDKLQKEHEALTNKLFTI